VNFSREEVELIMNGCPFNRPYIDVVSLDIYHRLFDDVSVYYEYLIDHPATPYQQLAFIPGTFTDQQQNAVRAKTFLADFLFAADLYNAHCDLPLGPTGVTGMYDGCRVSPGGLEECNLLVTHPVSIPLIIRTREFCSTTGRPRLRSQG
jgi:hypothetical protein